MICGECGSTEATLEHVRQCGREPERNTPAGGRASVGRTELEGEGRCTVPGCSRRTTRDPAGELRVICSMHHDAGVRPPMPGERRDYATAEATTWALKHRPPRADKETAHARIRELRALIRPTGDKRP